jgi:hypothetical protein
MSEAPALSPLVWDGERAPLAKAFVAAQKATESIKKAATNPAFKSKYADLAHVVEGVIPALNNVGVGVLQSPAYDGEFVSVTTTLLHESGASVSGTLHLRPSKSDPQGLGSAITYGRRYALLAMTGSAPEDDDGNAASGPRERQPANITPEPEGPDWPGCDGPGRTSHACKQDGTDLVFKALRKELSEQDSMTAIGMFMREHTPTIAKMPRSWRKVLAEELSEVERVISGAAEDFRGGRPQGVAGDRGQVAA